MLQYYIYIYNLCHKVNNWFVGQFKKAVKCSFNSQEVCLTTSKSETVRCFFFLLLAMSSSVVKMNAWLNSA